MAKAKTKAKKKPAKKAAPKKAASKKAPAPKKAADLQISAAQPTGLRSGIYQVDDLDKAKAFYTAWLGKAPYFDEPFYVGYAFDGGQELGLNPDQSKYKSGPGGAVAYWRVGSCADAFASALAAGGTEIEAPHNVGGDIEVAVVGDPFGNLVGMISGS